MRGVRGPSKARVNGAAAKSVKTGLRKKERGKREESKFIPP